MSVIVTCLTCTHATATDKINRERNASLRAMAKLGYVNCTLTPGRAGFRAFDHRCHTFNPLDADAAAKRLQWRAQQATA